MRTGSGSWSGSPSPTERSLRGPVEATSFREWPRSLLAEQVLDAALDLVLGQTGRRVAAHNALPVDEHERRRRGHAVRDHRGRAHGPGNRADSGVDRGPHAVDAGLLGRALRRLLVVAGPRATGGVV